MWPSLHEAQKILVVGCSGSGKSTLTRLLAKKLNRPHLHLDTSFWRPGWVETPTEEWREKVKEMVMAPQWIMDGTFTESFDLRFPVADKIIILELSPSVCLWRAILRVLKYNRSDNRSDLAEGCHEKIDLNFYKYILTYQKKVMPQILSALKKYKCEEKAIFLRGQAEVDRFISELNDISSLQLDEW